MRKNEKLKEVYSDAQSVIGDWIKKEKWKTKERFPSVRKSPKIQLDHWQEEEKKRINNVYKGEERKRILILMFGIKLDTVWLVYYIYSPSAY